MKNHFQEMKIDEDDLKLIMGDEYDDLHIFINLVFCGRCEEPMTTIVDYQIYLNYLNDVILRGRCKRCGNPAARYLETGESKDKSAVAEHVKMVIEKYSGREDRLSSQKVKHIVPIPLMFFM